MICVIVEHFEVSAGFGGFPVGSDGKKESACNARDLGSIPGPERLSGKGNGNPFQYSCLENSMDRGAWQATVHGVAKSWTQLSNTHTHTLLLCSFCIYFIKELIWLHHPHCTVVSIPACHAGYQGSPSRRQHALWASLVAQLI